MLTKLIFMKHIFTLSLSKNLDRLRFPRFLILMIAMIAVNFIITSCVNEEPDIPIGEISENTEVVLVKDWFDKNKSKLRLPEQGVNFRTESQELILPFFEKEPDWDKFHHFYFPDGREVFEINLENTELYMPTSQEAQRAVDSGIIQNIMFVKDSIENRFDPLIVRYFPDDEMYSRDFSDFNYSSIDEKWSGWIDLFSYDEHHLIGFRIDQGVRVSTREFSMPEEGVKTKGNEGFAYAFVCTETIYDWYQITSAGGQTSVTKLSSTISRDCGWQDVGGSGSGGYYGGGTGGGGGGGGGGGSGPGGTPYNPPAVPAPKLRIEIDFTVQKHPRVNCIIGKLQMSDFVRGIASFVKTGDLTRNSVIKFGSLPVNINGQAQKSGSIITITINRNNLLGRSDLMVAKTVIHELVHAEIMAALSSKGITNLDKDFGKNFDLYVKTFIGENNSHHNYMADNLSSLMGKALMDLHKDQFVEDYNKFKKYLNKSEIPQSFYNNLFWEGLKETRAYAIKKAASNGIIGGSPIENIDRDIKNAIELMTKPCGQ